MWRKTRANVSRCRTRKTHYVGYPIYFFFNVNVIKNWMVAFFNIMAEVQPISNDDNII